MASNERCESGCKSRFHPAGESGERRREGKGLGRLFRGGLDVALPVSVPLQADAVANGVRCPADLASTKAAEEILAGPNVGSPHP